MLGYSSLNKYGLTVSHNRKAKAGHPRLIQFNNDFKNPETLSIFPFYHPCILLIASHLLIKVPAVPQSITSSIREGKGLERGKKELSSQAFAHLGRTALPSRLCPQEGGDQHDGDQGHQNGSLIILFIHVTLFFDIIFDSQIDLGYYTGVVPFSPPPAAGAGQGITPHCPKSVAPMGKFSSLFPYPTRGRFTCWELPLSGSRQETGST